MSDVIGIAVVFAILLGGIVFMTVSKASRARAILMTCVFGALLAICWWGIIESLGRPKPFRLEMWPLEDVTVLSAAPVENVAIYVWVAIKGVTEPRAYTLPWSEKSAQELQDAMNRAEADGTEARMAILAEGSRDAGEPMFYAAPQPPSAQKNYGTPTTPSLGP